MPNRRRIRIILAGALALLLLVALVFILNQQRDDQPTGGTAQVQGTLSTQAIDLIVQTLFAQTLIAEANVIVNVTSQVVIEQAPTSTPTPIPSFPPEALAALREELDGANFEIVSTAFATNLRTYASLSGVPDEMWCVVISPPVTYIPSGFSTRARDQVYFMVRRVGLFWDVYGSRSERDGDVRELFRSGGCNNV